MNDQKKAGKPKIFRKSIALRLIVHFGLMLFIFGVVIALALQFFQDVLSQNRIMDEMKYAYYSIVNSFHSEWTIRDEFVEAKKLNDVALNRNMQIWVRQIIPGEGENENREILKYWSTSISYSLNEDKVIEDNKDTGKFSEMSHTIGEDERVVYMVYMRKYVDNYNDNETYMIEIRSHLASFKSTTFIDNNYNRVVIGVAFAVALVWTWMYSRRFARPVIEMCDITKNLASLNFDKRCEVDSDDEISDLAESINEMSDKLKGALEELKDKNQLLVVELEKEKSQELYRKKLLSDVSHELKTPLAIISGYAEALQLAANKTAEKRNYYSNVIIEEANKMSKLVHDILYLSQIEGGHYQLLPERLSANKFLSEIINRHSQFIAERNVEMQFDAAECDILADPLRLEQIINNILSNALSQVQGGRIIRLSGVLTEDGMYRISVYNSGAHIAEEDFDKLWLPFFKADKSRNRKEGRYGIGLSIVKELTEQQGGRYGVRNVSEPEDGAIFTIDIPIYREE